MTKLRKTLVSVALVVLGLGGLHVWLNLDGRSAPGPARHEDAREQKLRVGFLPVT